MTPLLLAASGAVVVGGVLCVTARDVRLTVAGLVLALIAGPLLVDPVPTNGPLAADVVAGLVAGDLAWLALRDRLGVVGPGRPAARVGWVAQLVLAITAVVIGLALGHDPAAPFANPGAADVARAAALALLVLALPQVLAGASSRRIGIGSLLLVVAALIARGALAGSPTPLESIVGAFVEVAAAGSMAVVLGLGPGPRVDSQRIDAGRLEPAVAASPARPAEAKRSRPARPTPTRADEP